MTMQTIINVYFVSGCLWAMNPSKVGKMDEEVQKWSRKDPQAIKKAMVYPGTAFYYLFPTERQCQLAMFKF